MGNRGDGACDGFGANAFKRALYNLYRQKICYAKTQTKGFESGRENSMGDYFLFAVHVYSASVRIRRQNSDTGTCQHLSRKSSRGSKFGYKTGRAFANAYERVYQRFDDVYGAKHGREKIFKSYKRV